MLKNFLCQQKKIVAKSAAPAFKRRNAQIVLIFFAQKKPAFSVLAFL
jgi:hypothetical protein